MKTFVRIALILSFCVRGFAGAPAPALPTPPPVLPPTVVTPSAPLAVGSLQAMGHVGQSVLFILTLTAIDLMHRELKEKGISNVDFASKEFQDLALKTASKALNSGSIWTGLSGATVTGVAAAAPVQILTQMVKDQTGRVQLAYALRTSIMSTVAFLGWELGSQLWTQASLNIRDPKDFERLQELGSVLKGGFSAILLSKDVKDQRDLRILGEMLGNMMSIFMSEKELSVWFDQTWRMRIATGDFAVMLSAMIASGVIGSMLFPGAGTVAGFMFGILGGAAAVATPQGFKDRITKAIQAWYMSDVEKRLHVSGRGMLGLLSQKSLNVSETGKKRLLESLELRSSVRSEYFTLIFSRMFVELRALRHADYPEDLKKYVVEQSVLAFAGTIQMLDREMAMLNQVEAQSRSLGLPKVARAAALDRDERVVKIRAFLSTFGQRLLLEIANAQPKNESAQLRSFLQFIEIAYMQRFDERMILETMK